MKATLNCLLPDCPHFFHVGENLFSLKLQDKLPELDSFTATILENRTHLGVLFGVRVGGGVLLFSCDDNLAPTDAVIRLADTPVLALNHQGVRMCRILLIRV